MPNDEGAEAPLEEPRDIAPLGTLDAWDDADIGPVGVTVDADGQPLMEVQNRQPPIGLHRDAFICSSAPAEGELPARQECRFLRQVVTDADVEFVGDAADIDARPKRIIRMCGALGTAVEPMSLTDRNVYACTYRDPAEPRSREVIAELEERQRQRARRGQEKSKTIEV